jgi:dGTP triphosphohydrolase
VIGGPAKIAAANAARIWSSESRAKISAADRVRHARKRLARPSAIRSAIGQGERCGTRELFDCFAKDENGDMLPHDWRGRITSISGYQNEREIRQRLICDFISGMTDAYALDVYSRLKTTNRSAIFRPL